MDYYGIRTPDKPETPSYIWWISDTKHNAWMSFFKYPSRDDGHNAHNLPLADAIRAYEGIGYKCVRLKVEEI